MRSYFSMSEKQVDRSDGQLSICYIDLDGLKNVNDQYGHAEGDGFISTVFQVLTDIISTSDAAVRLGEDELLLILHNCSSENANHLLVRIETCLKKREAAEHKPFPIVFSYAVATYT